MEIGAIVRAEESSGEDQLSMIPTWSVVLAIIVFGAVQYLFHGVLPHHKHELLPMRLLMGYSWGTAFASYVLLVGYVSRDVKRRSMPAGLWMLIVVVMPGGIGAVVYFLLRQPLLRPCPQLQDGADVEPATSARSASSRWLRCAGGASAACRLRMCTAHSAAMTWPRIMLRRGCARIVTSGTLFDRRVRD